MANKKFSEFVTTTVDSLVTGPYISYIYIPIVNTFTHENLKISLEELLTYAAGAEVLEATLSSVETYQNNVLIDVTNVLIFFNGNEIQTTGLVNEFDSDTGTIVFNSDYTPFSGDIKVLYTPSS